jgi:hypothetical protein
MAVEHPTHSSIRRHLLGISGLICLAVGIYFTIRPPELASAEFVQGSCVKAGLVLCAAWLAFPQVDRLPGWMFAGLVGLLLVLATRPRIVVVLLRFAMFLVPIFVLIWVLRPKVRRGSTR